MFLKKLQWETPHQHHRVPEVLHWQSQKSSVPSEGLYIQRRFCFVLFFANVLNQRKCHPHTFWKYLNEIHMCKLRAFYSHTREKWILNVSQHFELHKNKSYIHSKLCKRSMLILFSTNNFQINSKTLYFKYCALMYLNILMYKLFQYMTDGTMLC